MHTRAGMDEAASFSKWGGAQQHKFLLYALIIPTNQREPMHNENQLKNSKGKLSFSELGDQPHQFLLCALLT